MGAEVPNIAFFGAMTLLAKEIRSALESRVFSTGSVKLYDKNAEGTVTEFADEPMLVISPDEDEIVDLDLAFLCGTRVQTLPYLEWPSRRGFVAIDLSGASLGRTGVPLVHSEIDPEAIADGRGSARHLIGVPHAVSHNLAALVAAARAGGSISGVEATALRPVSEMGEPGIDELHQQAVALLNFASVPQDVFGRQIAFNVIPSAGIDVDRAGPVDERIHGETTTLLGLRPEQVSIVSALVPIFHGHAMAVSLSYDKPPELSVLASAIQASRGLRLIEDPSMGSPVENAGEEAVAVLDLKADPHRPARVTLWTFCDNLKGGAALNAIRVAERVADLRRGAR